MNFLNELSSKHSLAYHRDLAAKALDPEFKEIFTQLAQDERKHYQIFETMQQGIKEFQETLILKTAGNIFKQMIAENKLDELDDSQLILYQKASEYIFNNQVKN